MKVVASKHEKDLKKVFQISPSTSSKRYEHCITGLWALDDALFKSEHSEILIE